MAIRFILKEDGTPSGVAFDLEHDIPDTEGVDATVRGEVAPSNIQQLGIATRAWAKLTPLLEGRFP